MNLILAVTKTMRGIWNRAIAAIRQAGFNGTILVPHAHWSTAADITPQAPFAGRIVDPANNWVLELHSYLDPDGTGTYRKPVASSEIGIDRLAGATPGLGRWGYEFSWGKLGPLLIRLEAPHSALCSTISPRRQMCFGEWLFGALDPGGSRTIRCDSTLLMGLPDHNSWRSNA